VLSKFCGIGRHSSVDRQSSDLDERWHIVLPNLVGDNNDIAVMEGAFLCSDRLGSGPGLQARWLLFRSRSQSHCERTISGRGGAGMPASVAIVST